MLKGIINFKHTFFTWPHESKWAYNNDNPNHLHFTDSDLVFYSGFTPICNALLWPTTVLFFMAHSCYRPALSTPSLCDVMSQSELKTMIINLFCYRPGLSKLLYLSIRSLIKRRSCGPLWTPATKNISILFIFIFLHVTLSCYRPVFSRP